MKVHHLTPLRRGAHVIPTPKVVGISHAQLLDMVVSTAKYGQEVDIAKRDVLGSVSQIAVVYDHNDEFLNSKLFSVRPGALPIHRAIVEAASGDYLAFSSERLDGDAPPSDLSCIPIRKVSGVIDPIYFPTGKPFAVTSSMFNEA